MIKITMMSITIVCWRSASSFSTSWSLFSPSCRNSLSTLFLGISRFSIGLVEEVEDVGGDLVEQGEVDVIIFRTSSSSLRVSVSKRFRFENIFSSLARACPSSSSSQNIRSSVSFGPSKPSFNRSRFSLHCLNWSQTNSDFTFTKFRLGANQSGNWVKTMIINKRSEKKMWKLHVAISSASSLEFFLDPSFLV